jgi:NAD(P)-dependent dehydrogenase (short-subunit alcohol dehydrogenase family)
MNAAETYSSPPKPQKQGPPGSQEQMSPPPIEENQDYVGSGRLKGKIAVITGGDSGIGRSVAIQFAKEGADVCIVYLNEHADADKTIKRVEELGQRAIRFDGDLTQPEFCQSVIQRTINAFGRIDILVNNAATQGTVTTIEKLDSAHVQRTFATNIFSFFYLTSAAIPHLKDGAAIINTTSIQAYDPSPQLMDYAATKAAILNFTRSLATELAPKKIRVNAVAPGPIWTPLVASSMPPDQLSKFGDKTLFKRPGQPSEVSPAFLFLAAEADSSFITGQVLHVNGGQGMFS